MLNQAIEQFFSNSPLDSVNITLSGTGINACSQVSILAKIGAEKINNISEINIASGSSYSFFVLFAYRNNMLLKTNYLNVDRLNRQNHKCRFYYAVYRLLRYFFTKRSFFENEYIDRVSAAIFRPEFYNLKLSDFPRNIRFWSYCNNRQHAVELSVNNGFGYLTLSQIFRACISIKCYHGYYFHKDYCFSDINFSPDAKKLKSLARKDETNNIIVNFLIAKKKNNTLYIKHSTSRYPKIELILDFTFFLFNIPNKTVNFTQADSINTLKAHCNES